MKNRPFHERVGFAIEGWRTGWRREKSFRTQVTMAGVALFALIVLRPAPIWWALIVLVVALILALELINAALEGVVDHLHPDIHPEIQAIKDMAAGAVLLLSLTSLVIGVAMVVDRGPAMLAEWGFGR
ncbi:MAG: diacylglycerol kinase [Pseudomonadota bacterium]